MKERRERRRESRIQQRLSCKLNIEGRERSGFVLDISRRGVFVGTKAKATPGTPVRLELRVPGREAPLVVEARVARLKRVPPVLEPVWTAGIGLSVPRPPPAYLELVESFARRKGGTASSRAEPAGAMQSFSIRAALIHGERARTVLVRCPSEAMARELALAELGEEWKILSVEIAHS